VVAMDTIADAELPIVGGLIWEAAKEQQTLVVGSSGVEYCLASYWQSIGETKRLEEMPALESVDNLFVMCGSASPATQGQIEYAERKGFRSICIDAPALMDPEKADAAARRLEDEIIEILRRGESVVAYAAKGPEDPAIAETRAAAKSHGVENAGYRLARIQGRMTKRIIAEAGIRRACVAGGDTSGYVTKELGIFALQVAAIIAPGTPICNATSNNEAFDGFELALKSGQLGGEAYFEGVRMGRPG